MKKFFLKILILFTGLLLLAYAGDWVISANLRKSETAALANWNVAYAGGLQSDAIIVGSSRARVQYNPQILDSILGINSYNLGIDGSHINRQILLYNTYRRYNAKPKYIIQNIDFATLYFTFGYQKEQFYPYFFDDSLRTIAAEWEKYNKATVYVPLIRYTSFRNLILEGLGINKPKQEQRFKGYTAYNWKWDGIAYLQKDTINYGKDTIALRMFDDYLQRAQQEGIRIIFVYAPVYCGATKKIIDIEGMYAMYRGFAEKYNIPILDYNNDTLCCDTAYFYNACHLNQTGAEIFSAKLARDIEQLGIIE
jgi:hypothetical protein